MTELIVDVILAVAVVATVIGYIIWDTRKSSGSADKCPWPSCPHHNPSCPSGCAFIDEAKKES